MNEHLFTLRTFVLRIRRGHLLRTAGLRMLRITAAAVLLLAIQQMLFVIVPWTILITTFDLTVVAWGIALFFSALHVRLTAAGLVEYARRIDRCSGLHHPLLCLAVELSMDSHGSDQLKQEAVRQAAHSLCDHVRKLPVRGLHQGIVMCCVSTAAFLGAVQLQPSMLRYWRLPLVSVRRPRLTVEPGSVSVPLNTPITLRLKAEPGVYPSSILTVTREGAPRSVLLRPDSTGAFLFSAESLTRSLVYSFAIGGAHSGPDTIHVVPPPRLRRIRISLTPPAYTGFDPFELPEGQGSFSAFPGTIARIGIGTGQALSSARLLAPGMDSVNLSVSGNQASGELVIHSAGRYTFELHDEFGQHSDSVPWFQIDEIADLPPIVRIVRPGISKPLTPAQRETLWVEAADDIGLRMLSLEFRKSSRPADSVTSRVLVSNPSVKHLSREVIWDLQELSLYPGDTVYYWARARDTRAFPAPQVAVSDTYYFRIPGFREIHEEIAAQRDAAQKGLEAARSSQQRVGEAISGLSHRNNPHSRPTWEDKQRLGEIADELRSQSDSLTAALEQVRTSIERMKESGISDRSILDKMDQVRRAVEDLVKQYGDSLLFTPPDPRQSLSWQDIRKSLERLEKSLPDLERQLENTLSFLERLKNDQHLASLAARAEALAQQQQNLSASPDQTGKMATQKDLAAATADLVRDIGNDGDASPGQDLQSLGRVADLTRNFEQALGQGRLPDASSQRAMSGSLLSLARELRSQMSGNMAQKLSKDRELLLGIARDALHLSQWNTGSFVPGATAPSPGVALQAQSDAFGKSIRKLDSLELAPPALIRSLAAEAHKAATALHRGIEAAKTGDAGRDSDAAASALRLLSSAALNAARSIQEESEGQGSGSEGMAGGLRRLSGEQAALNALTGRLLQEMLSESGSAGGQSPGQGDESLREQARRGQEEIANKLRELSQGGASGESEHLKKQIDQLSREAQELARMLHEPRSEVTERQERFLSRMLESALSIHRRDEGKDERKGIRAKSTFSPQPQTAASLPSPPDLFYLLRQRAMQGGFPEEYRMAVQEYVDSLGVYLLK